MALNFDPKQARAADARSSIIDKAGLYTGIITRAEALTSKKGTQGLGLSFKADDGASASYLDLYPVNAAGENLPGLKTANAIMACLGLRAAADGLIRCEKWDSEARAMTQCDVPGYPDMMNKRIGLLLQEVIENDQHGQPRKKLEIFAVFQPDTNLTASEILDKKTQPVKLDALYEVLMKSPVKDKTGGRAPVQAAAHTATAGNGFEDMADDIPF
mgnify:FL=1